MAKYEHKKIDKKWQDYWQDNKTFEAKDFSDKPKKYVLIEFPYPSGEGLHMGHVRPYVAGDVYSRFMRMKGHEVVYPIGWDAFGLPAENYAIKNKLHPSVSTEKNIKNAKKQVQNWGLSFDWSREINTTDPKYYKWTQWIFLQFLKAGLAFEATGLINWCPKDKTGLANEEVIDGCCERCGTKVEKKELRQWYLKITAYAEKLLEGLKTLDKWPEAVKLQQENWIGKSVGASIKFEILNSKQYLEVFTTRPDTIFGATYMVVAPEHQIIAKLSAQDGFGSGGQFTNYEEVQEYIEEASKKTDIQRTAADKEKTGVELKGIKAINPATKEEIPVFAADYVLSGYGTGAIMAVPAHDERDFEFAKKYNLPIKQVVLKNNAPIKSYLMGAAKIIDEELEQMGITIVEKMKDGDRKIIIPKEKIEQYEELITEKLDNGFWNEYLSEETVFIFKHKDGKIEKLILSDETEERIDELAAEFVGEKWDKSCVWKWLAENDFYADLIIHTELGTLINSGEFTGMNSADAIPLMADKFGKQAVQYKLRDWVFSRQRYWGEPIPVIHCSGECGVVPVPEEELPVLLPEVKEYEPTGTGESPLAAIDEWVNVKCPNCDGPARRETNTMPQWAGSSWYWLRYSDPHNDKEFASKKKLKYWQPVDVYFGGMEHTTLHLLYSRFWNLFLYDQGLVTEKEPFILRKPHGIILAADGEKMSKSRGNVVSPDDIVGEYGADTLRMYELFLGPHEMTVSWNDQGIIGVKRFLDKIWKWSANVMKKPGEDSDAVKKALNKLIKKVGEDIQEFKFNTAVSAYMEFYNEVKDEPVSKETIKTFLRVLYPFAPHICEEIGSMFGGEGSIQSENWPEYDKTALAEDRINLVVQINGKVRGILNLPVDTDEETAKRSAYSDEKIKKYLGGEPKKAIFIKNRLINFVI